VLALAGASGVAPRSCAASTAFSPPVPARADCTSASLAFIGTAGSPRPGEAAPADCASRSAAGEGIRTGAGASTTGGAIGGGAGTRGACACSDAGGVTSRTVLSPRGAAGRAATGADGRCSIGSSERSVDVPSESALAAVRSDADVPGRARAGVGTDCIVVNPEPERECSDGEGGVTVRRPFFAGAADQTVGEIGEAELREGVIAVFCASEKPSSLSAESGTELRNGLGERSTSLSSSADRRNVYEIGE
jgi:hypothetical protein